MKEMDLQRLMNEHGIELNAGQLAQFHRYFELLVEWNEKMNLTGITEQEQVYEKHFYDSLTAAFFMDFSKVNRLIDVGSGAGFPGIPLKICFPDLQVTILDSLKKRLTFLQDVVDQLQLTDVTLLHSRAEDAGHDKNHREKYDVATARAVARLSVLNEFCLPFVKKGGTFLVMKGANAKEELMEAKKAIRLLGGEIESVETFLLPEEQAERNIILIRKHQGTPSTYPRKAGIPLKKPII